MKISISVKIFRKSLIWSIFSTNPDFNQNYCNLSIFVKICENFDFVKFSKISISVKMFENSPFSSFLYFSILVRIFKSLDFG